MCFHPISYLSFEDQMMHGTVLSKAKAADTKDVRMVAVVSFMME